MRIAVLIPGLPRFCSEFDQFLSNLPQDHHYDFYCYLWRPRLESPVDSLGSRRHTQQFNLVRPQWFSMDSQSAGQYIQSRLPPHCHLQQSVIADPDSVVIPNSVVRPSLEVSVVNTIYNWRAVNSAFDLARRSGHSYDLVIRSRADIGLTQALDFTWTLARIQDNPNFIQISNNNLCGHGCFINDWFAVGLPQSMDWYSELINHWSSYNSSGLGFHPETLLNHHLRTKGYHYQSGPVGVILRTQGQWQGRPYSQDSVYHSSWGQWD